MPLSLTVIVLTLLQAASHGAPAKRQRAPAHRATTTRAARADAVSTEALARQVMLDRAGFSPGVIDGRPGKNTDKALAVFKESGGDPTAAPADAVVQYTITAEDASGPYEPELPADMMAQAKVQAMSYRTPLEALAERFHSTPALLQRLNRGAKLAEGDTITVPNVERLILPVARLKTEPAASAAQPAATSGRRAAPAPTVAAPPKPDVVISVSKSQSALTVTDESDRVIFYAPVTTGSEHDPLPIGEWKVKGVQFNPTFRYNPALFWDADPAHTKAQIPAGPNNPVGLVWIDLTKEHYGIHGTPEPSVIGRAASHGCVRLTNWDAVKLAGLVKFGTRVVFME